MARIRWLELTGCIGKSRLVFIIPIGIKGCPCPAARGLLVSGAAAGRHANHALEFELYFPVAARERPAAPRCVIWDGVFRTCPGCWPSGGATGSTMMR